MINFDEFVAAISKRCSVSDFDGAKATLLDVKDEFDEFVKFVQPITALQALMQPVVESLIVVDRGIFAVHRCSTATVHIESFFDPLLSPRNFAIVIEKRINPF